MDFVAVLAYKFWISGRKGIAREDIVQWFLRAFLSDLTQKYFNQVSGKIAKYFKTIFFSLYRLSYEEMRKIFIFDLEWSKIYCL